MQEKATLARPYARAAFEEAREEGTLKEWADMLAFLSTVVSVPLMRDLIGDPRLSEEQLAQLVIEICEGHLTRFGSNFVHLLVRAERLSVVPEIYEIFEKKRIQAEDIARVEVTSAYELDETQRKSIGDIMARRLGRKVDVTTGTDPSLIGGVIIRSGDSVIDASLRGRLRELGNEFAL